MAKHEQLNNADHFGLRVRTERRADLGDAVMSCPLFPHEFRRAQAYYPIVFAKDAATGSFRPLALFGLETGENLFLGGGEGWDAAYLPAAMRIAPFLIGRDGAGGQEAHVDMDHPRVTEAPGEGERVFTEEGGRTPLLEEARTTLGEVAEGDGAAKTFCASLVGLDLIEPFTFDATLRDGSTGRLAGLYVIAEERLAGLDGGALEHLNRAGALGAVFMAVASLSRLEDLVQRRNARLAPR